MDVELTWVFAASHICFKLVSLFKENRSTTWYDIDIDDHILENNKREVNSKFLKMPKDRRVDPLSSDRSRSLPCPCSSKNTEQFKTQSSLGLDENVQKWENVSFPVSVDHPHDKGDESTLRLTKDVQEWEQIRCPICMEHPHNAVLLQCSSFGKGCRPYMCNTSYRHSNCLDQFRKSDVSSPSMEILYEIPSVSSRTGEELQLLDQTGHYESEPQPKLCCPLCRGQIYGWTVVNPAREFMNSKVRSCSWETCNFSGSYSELRKHARSDHPFIRPSDVDIQRQHDWTIFEYERDVADMVATLGFTREEQEELGRHFDDLPAMVSPNTEEEDEENEDGNTRDYQDETTSNVYDYHVVTIRFELDLSPEDHDMETIHNSRQTNNFRWNRNMLPAGYERGASYANRRTNNNFRRNNSSRSNIPERMLRGLNSYSYTNRRTTSITWNNSRNNVPERIRHGLNSYRENGGFSRNGNFRGNGNFWGDHMERYQRRRSDSLRSRPSERMP
ncbi:hypothetical protein SADUNF_Sadunf03G0036500 [Salix dunnii]|uniref:Uncharacterized protein n=1 Tax=Salix dunnii TaxID=1413687 RepID=A0A835KB44_9ROSI|nr:hypothetical protein SADUNF_Sadunf03G0036500 [Salix dunnii]